MTYKVNTYELCEHIVEVNNGTEKIIGMIREFGDCYEGFVKDHGQVSHNGFELFDDRQETINSVIESYKELSKLTN